jgi:hypothetical protein
MMRTRDEFYIESMRLMVCSQGIRHNFLNFSRLFLFASSLSSLVGGELLAVGIALAR